MIEAEVGSIRIEPGPPPSEALRSDEFRMPRPTLEPEKTRRILGAPDEVFQRLNGSAFRLRFRLRAIERAYLDRKGLDVVLRHAMDSGESVYGYVQPPSRLDRSRHRHGPVKLKVWELGAPRSPEAS
jgi:hypothetical protein